MIDSHSTDSLSHTDVVLASANKNSELLTTLRPPSKTDAPMVHRLISECPPLDLNSLYCYLLLSEHFSDTCVVAESGGRLNGYVSAYIPPSKPDTLFVWQVAVHERARGQGVGIRMLTSLLQRPGLNRIRYIETTVGPSNAASRGMFARFATQLNAATQESSLFEYQLFGSNGHDEEPLIRIGPLDITHRQGV